MNKDGDLDVFILRLADKIAKIYPSNCSDAEDYVQAGHLKLEEIRKNTSDKRNFTAYAIVSICRAMRKTALCSMSTVSAPERINRLAHRVDLLLSQGSSESDICSQLGIDASKFILLKSLIRTKSWHSLFTEPSYTFDRFSFLCDIDLSLSLDDEDILLINARLANDTDSLGLTRKQRWTRGKRLQRKLTQNGYGV